MGQPAYPDWSKYQVPGADLAFTDSPPIQAHYVGPQFDTSAWNSVIVTMQNFDTVKYISGNLTWSGLPFTPLSLPNTGFIVGPSQTCALGAAVRGRLASIIYDTVGGVGTQSVQYNVVGVSHMVTKYDLKTTNLALMNDQTTYLANTNKVIPATFWYEGPVQIGAYTLGAGGAYVEFAYWDVTAAAFLNFCAIEILGTQTTEPHVIHFPAAPIQATVFNAGAGQSIILHAIPATSM